MIFFRFVIECRRGALTVSCRKLYLIPTSCLIRPPARPVAHVTVRLALAILTKMTPLAISNRGVESSMCRPATHGWNIHQQLFCKLRGFR